MSSRWDELFTVACELIDQVNTPYKILDRWSFGGGTFASISKHQVSPASSTWPAALRRFSLPRVSPS
jgi:hypothetical protein